MASDIWLCARQERLLAARSRWTQIFAAVFATLVLAIAASGYVLSGGRGIQDFARTAASEVAPARCCALFGALGVQPAASSVRTAAVPTVPASLMERLRFINAPSV